MVPTAAMRVSAIGRFAGPDLDALRESLGLESQGRLDDWMDESFGYRNTGEYEVTLSRDDDVRWSVDLVYRGPAPAVEIVESEIARAKAAFGAAGLTLLNVWRAHDPDPDPDVPHFEPRTLGPADTGTVPFDEYTEVARWTTPRGIVRVSLAESAVPTLAEQLGAHASTVDGLRLALESRPLGWNLLCEQCQLADVEYERTYEEVGQERRVERWCPLWSDTRADGWRRSYSVTFHPPYESAGKFGMVFKETYRKEGVEDGYYSYGVAVPYADIVKLLPDFEYPQPTPIEAEHRMLAYLRDVVAQRQASAPELRLRDWLIQHCYDRRVDFSYAGGSRRVRVVDVRDEPSDSMFVLELSFDHGSFEPKITFSELRQRIGRRDHQYAYSVSFVGRWIRTLIEYAGVHLGVALPAELASASADERLIACLRGLVAAGHLTADQSDRTMRNRFVGWLKAADIPHTVLNNKRRELLVDVRRDPTDCIFRLSLLMDPDSSIVFDEFYDYLPRRGDAGREYGYGVKTPYASLATLAEFFEANVGRTEAVAETDEDRLAAAMRILVQRGELGDGLPLRANRDRVTAWFEEAGVPHAPADWFWVNSE